MMSVQNLGTDGDHSDGRAARLLAAIVSSSDDAMVSKTLEGVVTSLNGGAQRLVGSAYR
jgi:PAS domain-containing protein